jgi:hypothetical protein
MRATRAVLLSAILATSLAGCKAVCSVEHDPVLAEQRAGEPTRVSRWAQPSDTGHYDGYLVGGGAVCHGDAPAAPEGTWGWDYTGWCVPAMTALGWYHGRCEQGGTGGYKTDGPKVLEKLKGEE